MDYYQGVVTDYLRAKRSVFVNTEFLTAGLGEELGRGRSRDPARCGDPGRLGVPTLGLPP